MMFYVRHIVTRAFYFPENVRKKLTQLLGKTFFLLSVISLRPIKGQRCKVTRISIGPYLFCIWFVLSTVSKSFNTVASHLRRHLIRDLFLFNFLLDTSFISLLSAFQTHSIHHILLLFTRAATSRRLNNIFHKFSRLPISYRCAVWFFLALSFRMYQISCHILSSLTMRFAFAS